MVNGRLVFILLLPQEAALLASQADAATGSAKALTRRLDTTIINLALTLRSKSNAA